MNSAESSHFKFLEKVNSNSKGKSGVKDKMYAFKPKVKELESTTGTWKSDLVISLL